MGERCPSDKPSQSSNPHISCSNPLCSAGADAEGRAPNNTVHLVTANLPHARWEGLASPVGSSYGCYINIKHSFPNCSLPYALFLLEGQDHFTWLLVGVQPLLLPFLTGPQDSYQQTVHRDPGSVPCCAFLCCIQAVTDGLPGSITEGLLLPVPTAEVLHAESRAMWVAGYLSPSVPIPSHGSPPQQLF